MKRSTVRRLKQLKPRRPLRELPERERVLAQLQMLDEASGTTRGLRELAIIANLLNERLRTSVALADLALPSFADNVGIVKAAQIEEQAARLRAQLR